MARAFELEIFDDAMAAGIGHDHRGSLPEEEQKLQSFEKGYSAGWDDAVNAQSSDKKRVSSELDQSLQGLSFTYHEARSQILNDLKPLLTALTETLLPSLALEQFGQKLSERIFAIAQATPQSAITLRLRAEDIPLVEELLAGQTHLDLDITPDGSLGPGQAALRFGDAEEEINFDSAFQEIRAALSDFYQPNKKAE